MVFVQASNAQPRLAVIGLGCWYPGARNPRQLWEGILARRREFRRLPDCRLPLADYHDPDPAVLDKTYGPAPPSRRLSLRLGRPAYSPGHLRGTDIVQWLALEVAEQALGRRRLSPATCPASGRA